MIRHPFHFYFSFVTISFLLLLSSCNDQPSEVGTDLWIDTVTLHSISTSDTTLFSSTSNETKRFGLFRLGGLLLGKYEGITAITFVRFTNIPDTLNYVTENDIQECTLELTSQKYSFGDTVTNRLEFTIHKINNLWFNLTTWDSIVDPTKQPFYGVQQFGSFSGISTDKDTLPLKVTLDKSIASEFFRLQADSNLRITNYGLALVPNGNTSIIRRFSTKSLSSSDQSKYVFLRVVFRNQRKNNALDTVLIESGVDATMVNDATPNSNQNLVIQGSLMKRAKIEFDLTMIPKDAFIHYAQLSFVRNEAESKGGTNGIDEFIGLSYYDNPDNASITPTRLFLAERTANTQTYTFKSIVSLVEQWLRYSNGKGVAYLEPEGTSKLLEIDKVSFYGISTPDSTKRPSLKIIYSTRPGFGRR